MLLLVMAVSYVSAGISGAIVFREWKPWARMGLWNCFTVATLVAAVWLRRTGENIEEKEIPNSGGSEPAIQSAETEVSGSRAAACVTTLLALAFLIWVAYSGFGFIGWYVGLVLAELFIASFVVGYGRALSGEDDVSHFTCYRRSRFSAGSTCAVLHVSN